VVPEILIVGDPSRRRDLIDKVRACHYDVSLCAVRELNRRIRTGPPPAAILVCGEDVEPGVLLAGLRRSRQGAAVPVVLIGRLGGAIRDLADVLDLGADQFVEDPVDAQRIEEVLLELAGPPSGFTDTQVESERPSVDRREQPRRTATPMMTEIIEGDRTRAPDDTRTGRDPVLGQLHRTLDLLEARLRDRDVHEDGRDGVAADVDLSRLGIAQYPDIDDDAGVGLSDPGDPAESSDTGRLLDPETALETGDFDPVDLEPAAPREIRSAVLRGRRPARAGDPEPSLPLPSRREPPPPRRAELPRAGPLAELDVPRLLWRLHDQRFSGSVTLQRGREHKQVWLEAGDVTFVRSNSSRDRFVDGLLQRGILTRPQYETARRLAAKQPGRAGRLLVEAGFVKSKEMHRLLQEHLARVVDDTFAWDDGSWSLDPNDRLDERVRIETPMPVFIREGIRFRLEVEQLRARLGSGAPRLRPAAAQDDTIAHWSERLVLSELETSWCRALDGRTVLDDLPARVRAEARDVLAVVYALDVAGALEGATASEAPEPETHDPRSIDAERLLERLRLAREADYFALLGVPRDASRGEIRRAHAALRATFASHQVEAETRGTYARELEELQAALDDARDVLVDDAVRSAYLAHLGEP
jgi:hypothetical protein